MSTYDINNKKQLLAYKKIRDDINNAIFLYEERQTVDLSEESRKHLHNKSDIYIVEHYVKGSNIPRGELFINWPFYF